MRVRKDPFADTQIAPFFGPAKSVTPSHRNGSTEQLKQARHHEHDKHDHEQRTRAGKVVRQRAISRRDDSAEQVEEQDHDEDEDEQVHQAQNGISESSCSP